MLNYDNEVVSALNAVLPTHYEMALTSKTAVPCISYMELNNYTITEPTGADREYSRITYQIKVWANIFHFKELANYVAAVDKALRPLGFKRVSTGELYDGSKTMIQKILTYECLALEEY
jgi:hypothetical protein